MGHDHIQDFLDWFFDVLGESFTLFTKGLFKGLSNMFIWLALIIIWLALIPIMLPFYAYWRLFSNKET